MIKEILVRSLGCHNGKKQVSDDRVILQNLGLDGLDLGTLVKDKLVYLVNLVVDWHQSLLGQFEFGLGFGLGGVVLFTPECEFLVHGLDVISDELDGFAKGSCVLTNALNHGLDKFKFFPCEFSS